MILWTLQPDEFWHALRQRGRVRNEWRHARKASPLWMPAYVWMARQMVGRGRCRRPVAPIWAWHSCGALGRPPNQGTIEAIMCHDGSKGFSIELDVPDELVLLSHYGFWNEIVDACFDAAGDIGRLDPEASRWERVFDVDLTPGRRPWGEYVNEDIQACLPYVDVAWVRSCERYVLPLI